MTILSELPKIFFVFHANGGSVYRSLRVIGVPVSSVIGIGGEVLASERVPESGGWVKRDRDEEQITWTVVTFIVVHVVNVLIG